MVASQSIAGSSHGSFADSGSATTCAAASALRVNGLLGLLETALAPVTGYSSHPVGGREA